LTLKSFANIQRGTGFAHEFEVGFASESACHGLHLLDDLPTDGVTHYWALYLDLDPRKTKPTARQFSWSYWTLQESYRTLQDSKKKPTSLYMSEISSPERAMQQICKIVRGVGGKVGRE
jgi:hypothetical protein